MRIFGVNIPDNKRIEISLQYLYGVGPAVSKKALAAAKIEVVRKQRTSPPTKCSVSKTFWKRAFRWKANFASSSNATSAG